MSTDYPALHAPLLRQFREIALNALEAGLTEPELQEALDDAVEEHQAPETHVGGGPKP